MAFCIRQLANLLVFCVQLEGFSPLFIECGIRLANNDGYVSYITPDSFLVGRYFSKTRDYLLANTKIKAFIVFSNDFWESGDVGFPTIFVVQKLLSANIPSDWEFTHARCDSPELLTLNRINYAKQKQNDSLTSFRSRFTLFQSSDIETLVEKIRSTPTVLDNLLSLHHGVRSKIGRDKIISQTKRDSSWEKAIISSVMSHN